MGIRDIKDLDREDVADFVWKWRCKILRNNESDIPKTVELDSPEEDDATTKETTTKETTTKAPAAASKDPGFGSEVTVKTMYEGRNSTAASYEWVDYPPKQLSKSAARAQDRPAIKAYKVKDREKPCIGGRYPLRYHQIEVQNPLLVAALEPIVKKENVFLDLNETATFEYPFRPLWFGQDDITELYKKTESSDPLKNHLNLMLRLMDDMFSELRVRRKHLQASGLVDYRNAWILYPKDSTLYSYGLNAEFLVKVETSYYISRTEGDFLIIKGKTMSFNGEEFVWQEKILAIKKFQGNKLVRELDHYPLDFHPDGDAIKRRCIARGKKVLDFQGLRYCCYNGIAIHSAEGEKSKHNVEGRVLIDAMGYNKYHLAQGSRENKDPETERNRAGRRRRARKEEEPDAEGEAVQAVRKQRLTDEEQQSIREDMLSREEDLGFMSQLIGGYALKNKLWVQFYVEDIEPMVWNDTAYSHLVYDGQQKDLVLSFVENHNMTRQGMSRPSAAIEDVIRGKGQGLILLLSGPPGTGKTLTAEAVADRTHRPLFYLQAEDLGINAAALGANIKRVFEMATDWDAVILLDEADVFMAERNPNDIHRNELVSIFLRELEYFRGIIFLTTNLYHTIDTAFRSRVNLHLLFQSLSKEARETVWRKFLDRLPEQEKRAAITDAEDDGAHEEKPLDEDDIKQLALWQLNGREIKNAVKMVRSWCDHKGYMLTLERLENGIKVTSPHASKEGDVDRDLYD